MSSQQNVTDDHTSTSCDKVPPLPPFMTTRCTARDIQMAYGRIRKYLPATQLRSSFSGLGGPAYDISFKCEHEMRTGSFKERGALNTLMQLSDAQKQIGVTAASAGNHAQALAYHGRRLGIPVTVIMPTIAPLTKIEMCRQYGAKVIVEGATIDESKSIAEELTKKSGQLYINGYDAPPIVAGQGCVAVEIMEQCPDVEAIVVPVGGAGLIAGIALAAKNRNAACQIIGVETEACPSYSEALRVGKPVKVETFPTIADGLYVPQVGAHSFEVSKDLVDQCVVVQEKHVAQAQVYLLEREKMLIEGAGAAGVAAILSGQLHHLRGIKTVIVLCGGNMDITAVARVIERGLFIEKRFVRFNTYVPDRPGGLSDLCRLLSDIGVSVKDVNQERPFLKSSKVTKVRFTCETRGPEHSAELFAKMERQGYKMELDEEKDEGDFFSNAVIRGQEVEAKSKL